MEQKNAVFEENFHSDCNNTEEKSETFIDRLWLLRKGKDFFPTGKTDLNISLAAFEEKKKKNGSLTQADIAKIAGVSGEAVKLWYNKHSPTTPRTAIVKRLSDAFNVSVEWLLGQTDAPTLEQREGFEPFKKFGFSFEAYQMLCVLHEQGEDMKSLMHGINNILEFSLCPQADLKNLADEFRTEAENEMDLSPEDKALYLKKAEDMERAAKQLSLPALVSLNKFFDLYKSGTYIHAPAKDVVRFRRDLEAHVDSILRSIPKTDDKEVVESFKNNLEENLHLIQSGSKWSKIFSHPASPVYDDSAALFELENTLKEIKKQLVRKEKQRLDALPMSQRTFTDTFESTFPDPLYGYAASHEFAIKQLSDFYLIEESTNK